MADKQAADASFYLTYKVTTWSHNSFIDWILSFCYMIRISVSQVAEKGGGNSTDYKYYCTNPALLGTGTGLSPQVRHVSWIRDRPFYYFISYYMPLLLYIILLYGSWFALLVSG